MFHLLKRFIYWLDTYGLPTSRTGPKRWCEKCQGYTIPMNGRQCGHQ
jgi:hypothetical protein